MNIPEYTYAHLLPDDFNWFIVLKDLVRGAPLDAREHITLCRMAGNWPTCACGQLCSALPRSHNGHGPPKDWQLKTFGMRFAHAINKQRWATALQIMHQIEDRSTMLLNNSLSESS